MVVENMMLVMIKAVVGGKMLMLVIFNGFGGFYQQLHASQTTKLCYTYTLRENIPLHRLFVDHLFALRSGSTTL